MSTLFHTVNPIPALAIALATALTAGCASRPQAPITQEPAGVMGAAVSARVDALLPVDVLLIGEQHDAAEHQVIEQQVVAHLAARGLLAAVALEMADSGATTAQLQPRSTDEQAQRALKWNDKGWPWKAYGPAVMTAVRAGVPVLGANLPRALMKDSMADNKLDGALPGPALKTQQQQIRIGHCNLLPESQITPMTRIQIAKDVTMANTLRQVVTPGKVVVLLAGSGHADRYLGVPQHLPNDIQVKAVRLRAANTKSPETAESFDSVWPTQAVAEKDYCEGLDKQLAPRTGAAGEAAKP
ncbi:MAG: hypothetical protein EOO28_06155 [Comamonadaceae bacterium]|nr:MAG: hypothetical protein EOO28_06155 [Comamonadaceae bacterium]